MTATPRYQVLYPETVRQAIRDLLQQAADLDIRSQVVAALRTIDDRLRSSPLDYGDAHNRLQRWMKYVRVQSPLFVRYAVSTFLHEDKYLVYVSAIEPLSGHGLER